MKSFQILWITGLAVCFLGAVGCVSLDERGKTKCEKDEDCLSIYYCSDEKVCELKGQGDCKDVTCSDQGICKLHGEEAYCDCEDGFYADGLTCIACGCAGRCAGADDGCGNLCSSNDCAALCCGTSCCSEGQMCNGQGQCCDPIECVDYKTCETYKTCESCPSTDGEKCNNWDDDCNPDTKEEGLQLDCSEGQLCKNGVCCADECPELGKQECADTNSYQTCGNFDDDGCLEWSLSTCDQGYTCQGGSCPCTAKSCTELGHNCGQWDNGCGVAIQCGGCTTYPNLFCVEGSCGRLPCTSDGNCKPPVPRCDTDASVCVQCLTKTDCGAAEACIETQCVDAPLCQSDDQCDKEKICEQGNCVPGCRGKRDCLEGKECLIDVGPHGTCAECQTPEECGEGMTCSNYQCTLYCTKPEHCAPKFCLEATHLCVDCIEDADCGQVGLICEQNACIEGCRDETDCLGGYCKPETKKCVECLDKANCSAGMICFEDHCVAGCDNARDCPENLLCNPDQGDHGTCVECINKDNCDPDELCLDGLCVFHCTDDLQCQAPTPGCDTASGICVACTKRDHCPLGTLCVSLSCVPGCQETRDCDGDLVCDPNQGEHGVCVECLDKTNCPEGYDCNNNFCEQQGGEMVQIPGGDFVMGSDYGEPDESPARVVFLTGYLIDRTEVTNDQYRACINRGRCTSPYDTTAFDDPTKGNHPVVYVTWYQAQEYCNSLGKTLPTEAQWERAARAPYPDQSDYPWGSYYPSCELANYLGCQGATWPVGSAPDGASNEGLLDLAGNVWEWALDCYADDYYAKSNNKYDPMRECNLLANELNVIRGGAFDSSDQDIRSINRGSQYGYENQANLGFRCVTQGIPVADFFVDPEMGNYATTFQVDSSSSVDYNTPSDMLEVHWDWEGDGEYDTDWSTAKTATHNYTLPGIFRIQLEVRDPEGNTDSTNRKVAAQSVTGWDGYPCSSNAECAQGFKCVTTGAEGDPYYCREDCGISDPICLLPGRICWLALAWIIPEWACMP